MTFFRQLAAVAKLNFKGLRQRVWTSLVTTVAVGCVIAVLISMLSFSNGLRHSIDSAANPLRAIVVAADARDEFGRNVTRAAAAAAANASGVAKDTDGKPIASAEQLTNVPVRRQGDGLPVRVTLRGIGEKGLVLRPELKLVSGRLFARGKRELIVGTAAQAQFEVLGVGSRMILPDGEWTIVGNFETGGDIVEGQLLGDSDTLMPALRRNGYGSVIVQLTSREALEPFRKALAAQPALAVDVERQSTFYARGTLGQITRFQAAIAYMLAGIMALGALFGTLNTMYSAVAARTREIATLRAIGFRPTPVIASVLSEALLLALTGALAGCAIAWVLFDGNRNATGPYVFHVAVTPALVAVGITWAVVIAFLGGIFPALRAARMPVVAALRDA